MSKDIEMVHGAIHKKVHRCDLCGEEIVGDYIGYRFRHKLAGKPFKGEKDKGDACRSCYNKVLTIYWKRIGKEE